MALPGGCGGWCWLPRLRVGTTAAGADDDAASGEAMRASASDRAANNTGGSGHDSTAAAAGGGRTEGGDISGSGACVRAGADGHTQLAGGPQHMAGASG